MTDIERNQLVLENLSRVQVMCAKFKRRLPPQVNFCDLMSDGTIGLIQASRSFDEARGCKFWTHAEQRVRGEIIEGLRQDVGKRAWRRAGHPAPFVIQVLNDFRKPISLGLAGDREMMAAITDPTLSPEEQLDEDSRRASVMRAMDAIRPMDARVLRLSMEGHTLKAIGAMCGFNESRAAQRRRRAILDIRRHLGL